jgi:hypothetical protein
MGKSRMLLLVAAVAITSVLGGFAGSRIDSVLAGKENADSIAKEAATKADSIAKEPATNPDSIAKEAATKADSIAKEPATKTDSIAAVERPTDNNGTLLAEVYTFGIVFPAGSSIHPSTHGIGVFETKSTPAGTERYLLLQMEDASDLAKTVLTVSIDGAAVGSLSINAQGYGTMRIEKAEGEPFVVVHDGSVLDIKAADNSLVASGSFGAE